MLGGSAEGPSKNDVPDGPRTRNDEITDMREPESRGTSVDI